ncbi:hypothetical protein [Thermoflexus sp.]|uniref:hypothetical protein n=1 Tax=Thermoflexus sp. TaxID=1969742 RepID=UPI003C107490
MGRAEASRELEMLREGLFKGFAGRFALATDPWPRWRERLLSRVVDTTIEEAFLDDPEALSALRLGDAPVPVRRVRLFLRPDPDISQANAEQIQGHGDPLPGRTVVWIDVASLDAFRFPWMLNPGTVAYWIGRLPVYRAVLGPSASLLMEFFRDLDLVEWVLIGHKFQPESWEIKERAILLSCKPRG